MRTSAEKVLKIQRNDVYLSGKIVQTTKKKFTARENFSKCLCNSPLTGEEKAVMMVK